MFTGRNQGINPNLKFSIKYLADLKVGLICIFFMSCNNDDINRGDSEK